jgi:hypothetical protein
MILCIYIPSEVYISVWKMAYILDLNFSQVIML